jgi:hypothetical protein
LLLAKSVPTFYAIRENTMKQFVYASMVATLILAGCGTSFQGLKMRAQSPSIGEAFRKVSLAVAADGYKPESLNITKCILTTNWRDLKPEELVKSPTPEGISRTEYRLALRMEQRGRLYDVFLTPSIRYTLRDGTTREEAAAAQHPLSEKWKHVLKQLLELEQRDED